MRYLLIGLAVLAIALGIHAQFSIPQQPMFSNAVSSSENFATNLAHRWKFTDLQTNVSVSSWTDSITGVLTFRPWSNHVLTNTTNGVRFDAAGSAMTNSNGKLNAFFAAPGSDNWAFGAIIRLTAPDFEIRSWFGLDVNVAYRYQQVSAPANGTSKLTKPQTGQIMNNINELDTNYFDIVVASTNDGVNTFGLTFINGRFWTNFGSATGFTIPNTLGLFDYGGSGNAPDTFGMRGFLVELWARTNIITGNGLDGMAADIHWVRTNIYHLGN